MVQGNWDYKLPTYQGFQTRYTIMYLKSLFTCQRLNFKIRENAHFIKLSRKVSTFTFSNSRVLWDTELYNTSIESPVGTFEP